MSIKYSLPEIERRWLVNPASVASLDATPFQLIQDRYLTGTQLRLRKIEMADGQLVFKLGKKYGKTSDVSQPITNLYATSYSAKFSLSHRSRENCCTG